MLSDRVRPDVEAAPWVIKEILVLEEKTKKLQSDNLSLKKALMSIAQKEGLEKYAQELWPSVLISMAKVALEIKE